MFEVRLFYGVIARGSGIFLSSGELEAITTRTLTEIKNKALIPDGEVLRVKEETTDTGDRLAASFSMIAKGMCESPEDTHNLVQGLLSSKTVDAEQATAVCLRNGKDCEARGVPVSVLIAGVYVLNNGEDVSDLRDIAYNVAMPY